MMCSERIKSRPRYRRAQLDEISRMAGFILMHRYHGMRRSRFSRDSAAAAACSTLRFRPWGALTVSQVPQHVSLPTPTTLRPSAAMLAAQRATLHGAPRALALGPGRSRQRATPRHVGARRAVRFPAAHTCTIAEIFVRLGTALAAAGGGAGAQQGPAVARRPPRGCATQVHQLALAWRPGKGIEDAPFLGGDPRAICGHPAKSSAHKAHGAHPQAPDLLSHKLNPSR